jgi:hypothetical protein
LSTARAISLGGQALVDLQERHHTLDRPQVVGRPAPFDRGVHRPFEQDRSEDSVAVEARARDDARPHLVHQPEHLFVVGVGILRDAVREQRLWRTAAALIERPDEPVVVLDLLHLLHVHRNTA